MSATFMEFLQKLWTRKPKPKPKQVAAITVEELGEKQAEGLTYEQIYLNLLSGRIDAAKATEIIEGLGERVNPHPILWLKNKLVNIRDWIISAVKFLREVGNKLGLRVDKIEVELSITPHVTMTFQAEVPKPSVGI